MPVFRYQSTDAQGRPVAGEVEAASREEAVARLAARGLVVEPGELEEVSGPEAVDAEPVPEGEEPELVLREVDSEQPPEPGPKRLSSAQAAEVMGHVADLAKVPLPLPPGLRAMADELPDSGLAQTLRQLATELESGTPLEEAVPALGDRFPRPMRGMILAGVRTGRLAEVMEEYVDLERGRRELRRRIALILFYPGVLLLGVMALLVFLSMVVVPQFQKIFDDFAMELPPVTACVLWVAGPGVWFLIHGVVAVVVAVYLACTLQHPVWLRRVAYLIPLVGPVLRAGALAQFTRLMHILLGQAIPLGESLRLAADGLRDPALAFACRQSAERVEAGGSLRETMAAFWQFPPTLLPLVGWGERASSLAEAFGAAGEMFEGRLQIRDTLLATIVPPLALLLIAGGVGLFLLSLFLPLLSVVQALSG